MKKIIAVIAAFSMLFALASCNNESTPEENKTEIVTDIKGETVTDNSGEAVTKSVEETEISTDSVSVSTTVPATTLAPVSLPSTDPSEWSDEEIIEFYKAAAAKSQTKVRSTQKMTMTEIVANDGNGFLGTLVELVKPIFKAALKRNSTEFDGITGGYNNLVVSDAKFIKAYKSGEYTVVEMKMKEQTDGAHGDTLSGTVGHAISVVGDLSVVQENLPKFDIDFENADMELRYSNPALKVKINKDGIIEKGTWSYIVNVKLANLNIGTPLGPFSIKSGYGSVDYITTVGGGF